MSILNKQAQIKDEFARLSNWEDRYKLIIERGRRLSSMPEELKTEENKIKGCQSQVWLSVGLEGDRMILTADSDASIVKGLVALLVEVYSGESPQDILQTPPTFLNDLGLNTNLSQTRVNGLASMVKQIKFYAMAYAAKLGF